MNRRLFLHTPLTASAALLPFPGEVEAAQGPQTLVFDDVMLWLEAVCTRGGTFVRVDLAADVSREKVSEENYQRMVSHSRLGLLHTESGDVFWIPVLRAKTDPIKTFLWRWRTKAGRDEFAQRVSEDPAAVLAEARRSGC